MDHAGIFLFFFFFFSLSFCSLSQVLQLSHVKNTLVLNTILAMMIYSSETLRQSLYLNIFSLYNLN